MRVDDCAGVTYAAATLALRAHADTLKKEAFRIVFGARQNPAAIADNANALG